MHRNRRLPALRIAVAFFGLVLLLGACGMPSGGVATGAQPKADMAGTVWLCRPGQSPDPCTASLDTTVVEPNGSRHVVHYAAARDPAVDCFYVYPNITHQTTPNANREVDPQQTAIAELEASPFSQVCRVFAPVYREATGTARGAAAEARAFRTAYDSVLSAWRDYLAHYNHGRGVVLIGHSEGSHMLAALLASQVDQVPGVRKLLVSAITTGANIPTDEVGSGPPETVGPCKSPTQFGCQVDFNAYSGTPPSNAAFGRPPKVEVDGHAVEDMCTNPADLSGGSGTLVSMYRIRLATQAVAGSTTQGIFGGNPPTAPTPWVEYDGGYSARCVTRNGRHILMVWSNGRVPSLATHDASFGLHVDDLNLAMGNLVQLVRSQAAAYLASQDPPQGR